MRLHDFFHYSHYCKKNYLLSTFDSNLTHLTTNGMFSGQCIGILAIFFMKLDGVGPIDNRPSTSEGPPIGKIHSFSKIAVTLHTVMRFKCPSRFRISWQILWLKAPSQTIRVLRCRKDISTYHQLMNYIIHQSVMRLFVEQPRLHRVC